jgi:predicted anti-sigma-YlaC factor YlaD
MQCPDTDRLIDLLDPDQLDAESEAHLSECSNCRAELAFLADIQPAFRLEANAHVPDLFLQRARATIGEQRARSASQAVERFAVSGALGVMTTFALIVGTGLPEEAGLIQLLGYSALMGAAAMVYEARRPQTDLMLEV